MGVPKFFRYTSERYPCLNELVKQYQIPDFDNMYLDMNGIIHNCSHPDDSNPHFRITEEKIFKDIFHYIGILFQIIKPKKLFFMAIDGVAPRAKMNQQRGRRFRSAKEAEKLEENAKAKGEVLPEEKRFDSNCITPGTVFMARLHEQLRYFVKHKISTDPLWGKVKVILSGHETPGEGEHKIMDYIRWARSQPDFDPNTRHCLYGLDADLIMLGMCTHEPHFALLREEIKFGKSAQQFTSPEQTNFYLLHLSLLREYLDQEFIAIKDQLPFDYDIEKIVDDWVLMGFLVGNDFIPHLPNMHISNDALPVLYKTYMKVLPSLDGYINEAGDLNLPRFEVFMQELAKIDKEKFQDTYTDLKYFEAKTGRRPNGNERKEYKPNNDDTFNVNIEDIKSNKPDDELQALIDATQDMFMDDIEDGEEYEETSDEEANFELEFVLHKMDYYMNKLDYSKVTPEVLANQAEGYVRAIQWNLFYYYKGCPSWCWYYPHHYAPYISDIKDFKDLKITFDIGEPFKPFEQLLGVLPSASKHLLPAPFHDLMTDEDSPIVHYYPIHFETDLNGKKNDWEAVVLIPFIDEVNLLSAMEPCYQRLTEEEIKRNTHGPMLVYNWTSNNLGPAQAPEYFPKISSCHALETEVWRHEIIVPDKLLKRGMLPNANRDILFPGFPTMRHLKYKTSMKKCRVKVFDQPSRNETMVLQLLPEKDTNPPLQQLARDLLGKIIWVSWPHLTRAKVISVSNEKMRMHHKDSQNNGESEDRAPSYTVEKNLGNMHKQWISERSTIIEHNMNRLGIELGDVNVIIHAVNLKGYKYTVLDQERMATEEVWCSVPCGHALQAVVPCAHAPPAPARYRTPQNAYPAGDTVFLRTRGQYYGSAATVIDTEGVRSCRIKVSVRECIEPTPTAHSMASSYKNANHAAASCGISAQMLSRITGTILVVLGERNDLPTETQNKINLGLNLKFNKKSQEVSGYTRRCAVSNTWLYSARCVELVRSYACRFPEVFDKLAYSMGRDVFFEGDLWPDQIGENKPQEVALWLKSQAHITASRRQCGSEALEPEEMKALWENLSKQLDELKTKEKKVTLQVKWNLLYKPDLHEGNVSPDAAADFKLYDRVVCVARNISVPMGARGTITSTCAPPDCNPVRLSDRLNAEHTYQVMFDEPFPGALGEELFEENRFYRMMPANMLNISFGRNLRDAVTVVDNEPFGLGMPPTVLRREDGHYSAFANYSPPRDIKTPVAETFTPVTDNATKKEPESQPQENATHLLRSLLKISEDETTVTKKKNYKPVAFVKGGWQPKTNNVSTATKPPLLDWRQESKNTINNNTPKPQTQQPQQKPLQHQPQTQSQAQPHHKPQTQSEAKLQHQPETQNQAQSQHQPQTQTQALPQHKPQTESETQPQPQPQHQPQTQSQPQTQVQPQAQTQPQPQHEPQTQSKAQPQHQPQTQSQAKPQHQSKTQSQAQSQHQSHTQSQPQPHHKPLQNQLQQQLPQQHPSQQHIPQQHMPQQHLSQQHLPQQHLSQQHLPQQHLPQQHMQQQYQPQQQQHQPQNHLNHQPMNNWTNSNLTIQPPMPPFPSFGQPFQGPGPALVPMPQFHNHGQQLNHPTQQMGNHNQLHFPNQVPGVGAMLASGWHQPQVLHAACGPPKPPGIMLNHVDKKITPFVPLQVQTSHRRTQNQSGPPMRRDLEGLPASTSLLPQPQASGSANPPWKQEKTKPQRRRRPRIAANLPGLHD